MRALFSWVQEKGVEGTYCHFLNSVSTLSPCVLKNCALVA